MHFALTPEPPAFDRECRKPGRRWLARHDDANRPRDFWSAFRPDLREAFRGLCAYSAVLIQDGHVDHFQPWHALRRSGRQHRAYEWSNFRYADGAVNQRKGKRRVLDPFRVRDEWFRITLPSLQLLLTEHVPKKDRTLAQTTLEVLGLRDGEAVVRYRRRWFELYQTGQLTLDGLRQYAPLIARAVEVDLARGQSWLISSA